MKTATDWTERLVNQKQNTAKVRPCDGRQDGRLCRPPMLELGLFKGKCVWGVGGIHKARDA